MKRLAIFLPSLDGGGAERVMLSLSERFVARGIQCDLVIAINKGALLDQVPSGVHLVQLGKNKTIHALFALRKYLNSRHPDALLATVFTANICALLASMITPIKLRTVICEANPSSSDLKSTNFVKTLLNHIAARASYRKATSVIAISNGVRTSLIDAKLATPSKITVVLNPIKHVSRSHGNRKAPTNGLLVACGRLESQKDYPTLLRALVRVRAVFDANLLILGDGALRQELEKLRDNLGLADCVTFKGFVHDPDTYMLKANAFVHSARYEGFGLVLAEALSCGCPIVSTDSPGGTREVLADGKFGTLVPVGDDAAMADAIVQVLKGEVTFPDPSEHLHQFDIEQVTDAYLSVLFPDDKNRR